MLPPTALSIFSMTDVSGSAVVLPGGGDVDGVDD